MGYDRLPKACVHGLAVVVMRAPTRVAYTCALQLGHVQSPSRLPARIHDSKCVRVVDTRLSTKRGGERAGDGEIERAVTNVPRPRPPMAPRKPSFPKSILPRPIVKPAVGAKCCAWMRAHPYQKRCFRRRGPRHITERRHAATPSSLNRWLAHPIPPAL